MQCLLFPKVAIVTVRSGAAISRSFARRLRRVWRQRPSWLSLLPPQPLWRPTVFMPGSLWEFLLRRFEKNIWTRLCYQIKSLVALCDLSFQRTTPLEMFVWNSPKMPSVSLCESLVPSAAGNNHIWHSLGSWGWRRWRRWVSEGGVYWERAQICVSRVLMMSPVNNNTLIWDEIKSQDPLQPAVLHSTRHLMYTAGL